MLQKYLERKFLEEEEKVNKSIHFLFYMFKYELYFF